MDKGWIKLHRTIIKHWIFKDSDKFRAWIIILCEVNHKDIKVNLGNKLITCKRGDSLNSLDTWAKLFGKGWNKSKVRRFLKLLESDNMIVTKNELKTTRLTVCKYDSYQEVRNADETQVKRKRNASETQVTPNKNDKNIKNDKECEEEGEIDITKILNVDRLKEIYLSNQKLVNAVTSNPKNKINKDNLESRLNEFTNHLKQLSRFSETFEEYAKYFLNWCRTYKDNKRNSKGYEPHKNMTF